MPGQVAAASDHAATLSRGCLVRNEWICPEYLVSRRTEVLDALGEHALITVVAVVLGALVALPLALLSRRSRWLRGGVLTASTLIYTVPSIAMFSLLLPYTGLSRTTVVIGLALYSLTILVRNALVGLDGVPPDVVDAARGMGYGRSRLLWRVELPLALPSLVAGLRVATVSTVSLTTVGTLVSYGGLGDLIYTGFRSDFKAQVLTASVLCVVLAVVADLLLVGAQRALTPWARARAS